MPGLFNIGILHTACQGREGHEPYAPCTVEQLVNHGYQYWALGHVHTREILHRDPYVVYAGNLQGRHAREAGPKGASLVSVRAGRVVDVAHQVLDVVRWASVRVDLSTATTRGEMTGLIRHAVEGLVHEAGERPVALRLELAGATALHAGLIRNARDLTLEVETVLASVSDEIWLERLRVQTHAPTRAPVPDTSTGGRIAADIRASATPEALRAELDAILAGVIDRMPAQARTDALRAGLLADIPARAVDLALTLVENPEESRDAHS
ncbi:hypothetical protein RI056_16700 [Komagataeibacter nataicola]|uniref:metallophosphoesterase family protein n=1 Tax=Komagataeibacter nataicola TaxID=265960 RepID=UPI0028A67479|nr:hypothetical protein [Komagataeibacter nataicola]WNM08464.1 hypothetical protein RI056_16700 [Komagataeibacter nataicola]